jgi:hypothetical protein
VSIQPLVLSQDLAFLAEETGPPLASNWASKSAQDAISRTLKPEALSPKAPRDMLRGFDLGLEASPIMVGPF